MDINNEPLHGIEYVNRFLAMYENLVRMGLYINLTDNGWSLERIEGGIIADKGVVLLPQVLVTVNRSARSHLLRTQRAPEEGEHSLCVICLDEEMIPNVTYYCEHMVCQKCVISLVIVGKDYKCPKCNIPSNYLVGRVS